MSEMEASVLRRFRCLVGLPLCLAHRAADMRCFHFGAVRVVENGRIGGYALHVQCPWRLEGPEGVVTGRGDLWEPAPVLNPDRPDFDWEAWEYNQGNLQDERIGAFLGPQNPGSRTNGNANAGLLVERVSADRFGGVQIDLQGGYRISLFPHSSRGEHWRLFRPRSDGPHLVFRDGRAEE